MLIARSGVAGLADQALISVVNFGTIVLLARELPADEFGAFVLGYTALLLANGLQGAVLAQPHNVLGQARTGVAYRDYTRTTAVSQLALAAGFAAVALGVAAVATATFPPAVPLLLALAPAVVAWQIQEFARRVLYTENRIASAFLCDFAGYGGQLALLAALAAGGRLTTALALYAVAASQAVGALVGLAALRESLSGRFDLGIVRENWRFGRWLGAANVVSWLSGPLYLYLAAALLGAVGAAVLKAAQVLLGPLNAFLLFLQTILPVRFARARAEAGAGTFLPAVGTAYAVSAPVVLGYATTVAVFADWLLVTVYPEEYSGYRSVVILFCVYYVVMQSVVILSSALMSVQATQTIFVGQVASVGVGLPVGWLAIELWGVPGAVVGMITSAIVLSAILVRGARRAPPRPLSERSGVHAPAMHGVGPK